jgi:hypothetical protein
MLKITQKITLEGKSIIDGAVVSNFVASINSDDPTQMTISSVQVNKALYKEHRVAVRLEEAEFEDYAYSVQDEMIAEIANARNIDEIVDETTENI